MNEKKQNQLSDLQIVLGSLFSDAERINHILRTRKEIEEKEKHDDYANWSADMFEKETEVS